VPDPETNRSLDIITGLMLGLVAVVTALGAWQASAWDAGADEFERDAGDARDVSINQSVGADYAARTDLEASATARELAAQREQEPDELGQLLIDNKILATLASTTPGFADAWLAWQRTNFDPAAAAIDDPDYLAGRDGNYQSYGVAAGVLDGLSNVLKDRSGVLAQAALIQALALFLIGIAGVNRARGVRIGILALGGVVFIGGVLLALSAYGVTA
jgi:hypothetical protein